MSSTVGKAPRTSEGGRGLAEVQEAPDKGGTECGCPHLLGFLFPVPPWPLSAVVRLPLASDAPAAGTEQVPGQHLLSEWLWKGKSRNALHPG